MRLAGRQFGRRRFLQVGSAGAVLAVDAGGQQRIDAPQPEALVDRAADLFRFGDMQSWLDPPAMARIRTHFSSAGRTEPIRINQTAPGQGCDIGVEWAEFRTVQRIVVRFAGTMPKPERRRVERWEGLTTFQGEWKYIQHGLQESVSGSEWAIVFPLVRTPRVRVLFSDPEVRIEDIEVFGPSKWRLGDARIEWDPQAHPAAHSGSFEVYNGRIAGVTPLAGVRMRGPMQWEREAAATQPVGVVARVLYTAGLDVDRTIVTARIGPAAVSFVAREAIEQQPIDVAGRGVYIRNAASNVTAVEHRRRHADRFRILDAVAARPEQTLDAARRNIDIDRVVAFLGADSNNHKFAVSPAGHVTVAYNDPRAGRAMAAKFVMYLDRAEEPGLQPAEPPSPSFSDLSGKPQSLEEGWLPILTTEIGSQNDVRYQKTDFVTLQHKAEETDESRLNGDEGAMLISRVEIRNEFPVARRVHFFLRFWRLAGGPFFYGAPPADRPNSWTLLLSGDEVRVREGAEEYAVARIDTHGAGQISLDTAAQAIRYTLEMPGLGTHTLHIVIPGEPVTSAFQPGADYSRRRQLTASYWQRRLEQGMQLELPDPALQNLYRANLHHLLTSLTKDPARGEYYANAAALNYGPIGSESSPIIQALDMRGLHGLAEKCLQAFLSTQGLAVPTGEYDGKEGGFYHYWPSYTINQGFVLWGLAEHYFYTGDRAWLEKAAQQIVDGCDFIIRGRARTRRTLPDGRRPLSWGLAPAGAVGDPRSWKYSFMMSGYFYLGLKKSADALRAVRPADAERIAREAEDFRRTILDALANMIALSPVTRLRDGSSVPCVPPFATLRGFTSDARDHVDPDLRFSYASDCTLGALHLVKCELLDANAPETTWILHTLEDRFFMYFPHPRSRIRVSQISRDWFHLGGFEKIQPYYLHYQETYLLRDQIPNFLRGFFNTLAALCDAQNLSFQEELDNLGGQPHKTHEEAWFLQQLRIMLVMEIGSDLHLARGLPRAWLEQGKRLAVRNAPTYFGEVSYEVESRAASGEIHARVSPPQRRSPGNLYLRLRHPAAQPLRRVSIDGRPWSDFDPKREWIRLPAAGGPASLVAYY